MIRTTSHERWDHIVKQTEGELNLAEAALLIAADEYPELDIDNYLQRLDDLAQAVRHSMPEEAGLEEAVVALNHFLFVEQGSGPGAVLHVLNAPSPAATAALPIGREILERLTGDRLGPL